MGLDIRLPIGLMFVILGPMLLVTGLVDGETLSRHTGGAMTVLGYSSTREVTVDELLVLTRAARPGAVHRWSSPRRAPTPNDRRSYAGSASPAALESGLSHDGLGSRRRRRRARRRGRLPRRGGRRRGGRGAAGAARAGCSAAPR